MAASARVLAEPAEPDGRAGYGGSVASRCNRVGNLTPTQGPASIGALSRVHPAGQCKLAHLRCLGQRRLRSWSDHSGYDQSAVRLLRATKGGEGAVDSAANGMATDRHSARAAYRGLGQFLGRISEAKCSDRMPARTTDRQPASGNRDGEL